MHAVRASALFPKLLLATILSFAGIPLATAVESVDCARLMACAQNPDDGLTEFQLSATVTDVSSCNGLHVEDDTGAIQLTIMPSVRTQPVSGDRLRLQGFLVRDGFIVTFFCSDAVCLSHGTPPAPRDITADAFLSGSNDFRLVRMTGVIRDIFPDENDVRFRYYLLLSEDRLIYAAAPTNILSDRTTAELIGAHVRMTGTCSPRLYSNRLQIGRTLQIRTDAVDILQAGDVDPFEAPSLGNTSRDHPSRIASLGRRRVIGTVIASWPPDGALLRRQDGSYVTLRTDGGSLPRHGTVVEAVGFPETDLYSVSLAHARLRALTGETRDDEPEPIRLAANEIVYVQNGETRICALHHGHPVRLTGLLRSVSPSDGETRRLYLEDHGVLVPVLAETPGIIPPDLALGTGLDVTGVCVMQTELRNPTAFFPKMTGFTLIVRRPDDFRVLTRPSWWTPTRFRALIGLLLAALLGILLWNRSLHLLAIRRGRELSRRQMQALRARLKVRERTRLAMELHDAISQSLTGIALQFRSLSAKANRLPPDMRTRLDIASRSLGACRDELKNVLWDLRNDALALPTLDEAIRTTLAPHLGDATLYVRFAVQRQSLSDNAVHTILCIVRELAANAVRHGHASHIRIAGAHERGSVLFSVSDDGVGFDLAAAPGLKEGHFGLLGVRERVAAANGKVTFACTPGKGTHVTVTMNFDQGNP